MQHMEFGEVLLKRFIELLEDISKIDQPLKAEGRTMAVTLAPDKDKIKKIQTTAQKAQQSTKEQEVNV